MIPYANPLDRARALYRIPTAPQPNRTLEICHGREPLLSEFNWPGEAHRACVTGAAAEPGGGQPNLGRRPAFASLTSFADRLPFAAKSFDLVILHRTLDDLAAASELHAARFDAAAFLNQVVDVLAPGGLVAGCVDNRHGLKRALRKLSRRWLGGASRSEAADPAAAYSLSTLRALLVGAQLSDIRLFTLLPDCDAPMKLVDADAGISKLAFRSELEAQRHCLSPSAYLARRVAVELGLARHLESAIFFWGYRAC